MKIRHHIATIISAVLLTLLALPVTAQDAGRLLFVQGDVRIQTANGGERFGRRGDIVREEERILTGARSVAQVRLNDGALLALRSNSDYLIERQRYDAEDDSLSEQAGRLFRGFMRKVTGAIGAQQPSNVSQRSPVATIGIRGTVFQLIHIPEGGLPEFPDISPGSYMMVESGQVAMQTDTGMVLANPGDIFYVADESSLPTAAPGLKQIFRGTSTEPAGDDDGADEEGDTEGDEGSDDGDGERRERGERGERREDVLIRETVRERGENLPQLEKIRAVSTVRGGQGSQRQVLISGEDRITEERRMLVGHEDGNRALIRDPERSSTRRDRMNIVNDQGRVASEVHWGTWGGDNYSYQVNNQNSNNTGRWHYIFGSHGLAPAEITEMVDAGRLTGVFRYNHVGGTELTTPETGNVRLKITDGHITTDFLQGLMAVELNLGVVTDLAFGQTATGPLGQVTGTDNWQAFFSSEGEGIALSSSAIPLTGSIHGNFVGENAEGIISAVAIESDTSAFSGDVLGVAAFQRDSEPVSFPEDEEETVREPRVPVGDAPSFARFAAFAGLGGCLDASCLNNVNLLGVKSQQDGLAFTQIDGERRISTMDFSVNEESWLVESSASQPTNTGSFLVTNDERQIVSEVYWGIWDRNSVSAASSQRGELRETGQWHYMLASWVDLPPRDGDFVIEDLPLTGTFEFPYVGGTGLHGLQPVDGVLQLGSDSHVRVDFAAQQMNVDLAISGALQDQVQGTGSFSALYNFDLPLSGESLSGAMGGGFIGNGEGVASAIELQTTNGLGYTGTALFADRIEINP